VGGRPIDRTSSGQVATRGDRTFEPHFLTAIEIDRADTQHVGRREWDGKTKDEKSSS